MLDLLLLFHRSLKLCYKSIFSLFRLGYRYHSFLSIPFWCWAYTIEFFVSIIFFSFKISMEFFFISFIVCCWGFLILCLNFLFICFKYVSNYLWDILLMVVLKFLSDTSDVSGIVVVVSIVFFHSVWHLGSWNDEWLSIGTWTFLVLFYEILDLFIPSILDDFLWHHSGRRGKGEAISLLPVGVDFQFPHFASIDYLNHDALHYYCRAVRVLDPY